MLDLQPIKDRLAAATPGIWAIGNNQGEPPDGGWNIYVPGVETIARQAYRADAELIACAKEDLAALVAEVERLRAAIEAHREMLTADSLCAFSDMELWEALDA